MWCNRLIFGVRDLYVVKGLIYGVSSLYVG